MTSTPHTASHAEEPKKSETSHAQQNHATHEKKEEKAHSHSAPSHTAKAHSESNHEPKRENKVSPIRAEHDKSHASSQKAAHKPTPRQPEKASSAKQQAQQSRHSVEETMEDTVQEVAQATAAMRRSTEKALFPMMQMPFFSPFNMLQLGKRSDQGQLESLFDLPRQMLQLTDQMFKNMKQWQDTATNMLGSSIISRTNVQSTQDEYIFTVEMPGFNSKEVEINITAEKIAIYGDKSAHSSRSSSREGVYASQRSAHFERVFPLAADANADKAKAEFHDGLLTIRIPRSESNRSGRALEVHSKAA